MSDFLESGELEQLEGAFQTALDEADLEAPDAMAAIAAAEVVAALDGAPADELPEELEEWLTDQGDKPEPRLVALALRAIRKLESARSASGWERVLVDLVKRLG